MAPLIQAQCLSRFYKMGDTVVEALKEVDLIIKNGEMISIIGPSGSGKSTLMHLIGCLDTPTSGKILINGQDISNYTQKLLAKIRNQKIGFVFQQFYLLAKMSILENVMTPLIYAGVSLKERKERAYKALERVGLKDRVKHTPMELSGGQRQRAAIARALVNRPDILLADEPTGALDTKTSAKILELFQELNQEGGHTVIAVTHDPDVTQFTRRTIRLLDGKIMES